MDSSSSPEAIIRGITLIVVMLTVPLSLYIVSYGVDVLDVVRFILGHHCFNILVVVYLLLGCF